MAMGRIIVHREILPLGRVAFTYDLEGKGETIIPREFVAWGDVRQSGNHLYVGPYSFVIIEERPAMDAYVCRLNGLSIPLWVAFYKAAGIWRWIYYRLILTAMIWGLADVPMGAVPSWRHLGARRDD